MSRPVIPPPILSPQPVAVPGIICHIPVAPDFETRKRIVAAFNHRQACNFSWHVASGYLTADILYEWLGVMC